MSILYKTTRFADTFSGDKETNVRVQLLSWGYAGHQSLCRISGFQEQHFQRRCIQKSQHGIGRHRGYSEKRQYSQFG